MLLTFTGIQKLRSSLLLSKSQLLTKNKVCAMLTYDIRTIKARESV